MDEQELNKRLMLADQQWQKTKEDRDFEVLELLLEIKQRDVKIRAMQTLLDNKVATSFDEAKKSLQS